MSNQVIGIDELIDDLKKFDKLQAKNLKAIVKQAADPVLQKAKELAPTSESGSHGKPSGELKKSLQLAFEKTKKQGKKVIDVKTKKGKAVDENGRPYSQFVEYGRKKGNKGIVEPNPFMKPAIEDEYERTRKAIEEPLLKAFDTVMKDKKGI